MNRNSGQGLCGNLIRETLDSCQKQLDIAANICNAEYLEEYPVQTKEAWIDKIIGLSQEIARVQKLTDLSLQEMNSITRKLDENTDEIEGDAKQIEKKIRLNIDAGMKKYNPATSAKVVSICGLLKKVNNLIYMIDIVTSY